MILVTGATGKAGLEVVRALLQRDLEVRVFVRDPDRARRLFGDAVEVAPGDFADSASLRAALEGVEELVLSCSDDPRRVGWETGAIDAAAAEGVRRIVKLSSIVADPGGPVDFWDWHGRVDEHLSRSGVPGVILRCAPFMTNTLAGADQVADEGLLFAPAGDANIAMIDPRDIGAAVAAVLTSKGHDGRTYVITGPRAITYAQVAEELSAATARAVAYVAISDEDAKRAMIRSGMPDQLAGRVTQVFAMLRQGVAEPVTTTVQELTSRPPRDFADFASENADRFAPATVAVGR